jgi:hypothetical protein
MSAKVEWIPVSPTNRLCIYRGKSATTGDGFVVQGQPIANVHQCICHIKEQFAFAGTTIENIRSKAIMGSLQCSNDHYDDALV